MAQEFEYTVHYQKGTRVGARSLRMIHVLAVSESQAIAMAKEEAIRDDLFKLGYRVVRVDHFVGNSLVVDF